MGSLNPENDPGQELDDSGYVHDDTTSKEIPSAEVPIDGSTSLMDLSDDVLLYILRYCSPWDLKALGFTCSRLGALILDRTLWQEVDARDLPAGKNRIRWLLTHALTVHTTSLKLSGYARESKGCLGFMTGTRDEIPPLPSAAKIRQEQNQFFSMNEGLFGEEHFGHQLMELSAQALASFGAGYPVWQEQQARRTTTYLPRETKTTEYTGDYCPGPLVTLTKVSLAKLSSLCINLRELSLENAVIDCNMTKICMFPMSLRKLSLRGTKCFNLEKSFLHKIQDYLMKLEDLDVSFCDWVEPACMLSLSKMPCLSRLIMQECPKLSEFVAYASLATRYGFKALKVLDLRGSPVSDSEVSALGWVPLLEELYLSPGKSGPQYSDHIHFSLDPPPIYKELYDWEEQEPEYYQCKYARQLWLRDDLKYRAIRNNITGDSSLGSCVLLQHVVSIPTVPSCEVEHPDAKHACAEDCIQTGEGWNTVEERRERMRERREARVRASMGYIISKNACMRRAINMYPDDEMEPEKTETLESNQDAIKRKQQNGDEGGPSKRQKDAPEQTSSSSRQNSANNERSLENRPGSSSNGPGCSSNGPGSSSNGPNSSSNGPGSSSNGPNSSSNGPGSSSNGPNSSSNGPGSSSNGPNSSSNGPGSSSNGPNSSSNGPGSSSNGPNSSSNGPGSSSNGPNSSSNGPGSSSKGPNSSSNGPGSSSKGPNSSNNGPGSLSKGPNSSSNGPGSSSNGPNSSSNAPGSSSNGPNSSSNGPGSSSNGLNSSSNGPGSSSKGPNSSSNGSDSLSNGPDSLNNGPDSSNKGPNSSSNGSDSSSNGPDPSSNGPDSSNDGPDSSSNEPGCLKEPCATKASLKYYADENDQISRALMKDLWNDFKNRTDDFFNNQEPPRNSNPNLDDPVNRDNNDDDDEDDDRPKPKRGRVAIDEGASVSSAESDVDLTQPSTSSNVATSSVQPGQSAAQPGHSTTEPSPNLSASNEISGTIHQFVMPDLLRLQAEQPDNSDEPDTENQEPVRAPSPNNEPGALPMEPLQIAPNRGNQYESRRFIRFRHNEPPVVIEGCAGNCNAHDFTLNMYNNNNERELNWNHGYLGRRDMMISGLAPLLRGDQFNPEIRFANSVTIDLNLSVASDGVITSSTAEPNIHEGSAGIELRRQRILYVNTGRRRHSMYHIFMPEPNETEPEQPTTARLNLIYSSQVNPRLEFSSLVTDASIRRFGRADGDNINYVQIGPIGAMPAPYYDPHARPNRSNLRVLSVTGFRHITNQSLLHLMTAAPHLHTLDVTGTRVTETGVEHFRNFRPECQVRYGPAETPNEDSERPHSP